ncbi:MAG: M20/M25/M40 family metallo-hydrolase [Ignavibacteriaceae bacterium]|nr:M20/M25/M40 family metallo-hydrolase [Ignavibacteriaceae bacterium]
MKKLLLLFSCVILFALSDIRTQSQTESQFDNDSLITAIVSRVNPDSIRYIVQSLQDFQTRFLLAPNRFSVADWIENRFHQIGITDVERDSFMCHTNYMVDTTTLQINIVATIPGTTRPDEVYIIGGHYDSFAYGSPLTNAPGADDNASGSSAALEFARALIESGYQPEATIKFITFAAEELMLFGDAGCEHYAQQASISGMNIKLMINCDMISHTNNTVGESSVRINYYSGFLPIRDLAISATEQFSIITPLSGSINQYSDSYPFFEEGFAAVYFEEDDFSPYYHTTDDIISHYNMDYCGEVIKSAGATLIKYMFQNAPTGIDEDEITQPSYSGLFQNYPNPFNPNTKIEFRLASASGGGFVNLTVHDILGNEVVTLVNEDKPSGEYVVEFDGSNLPSGIYFYRLQAGAFSETRKMILLK